LPDSVVPILSHQEFGVVARKSKVKEKREGGRRFSYFLLQQGKRLVDWEVEKKTSEQYIANGKRKE